MCTPMLPEDRHNKMVDWCVWCVWAAALEVLVLALLFFYGSWRRISWRSWPALLILKTGSRQHLCLRRTQLDWGTNYWQALLSFHCGTSSRTAALSRPSTLEDKSLASILLIVGYSLLLFNLAPPRLKRKKTRTQQ